MSAFDLPITLTVAGRECKIRPDYRAALGICAALQSADYTDAEKTEIMLDILYVDRSELCDLRDAVSKADWFISGGEPPERKAGPKLIDWEQDFPHIVAPINALAREEIRSLPYMHWWTFLGYYHEIGSGTLSNVVSIRNKRAKHKKLEKWEQEFLRDNRALVEFKSKYSENEQEYIKQITGR